MGIVNQNILEQGYQNALQSPDYYKGLWTTTLSSPNGGSNWFQNLGGWKGVGGAAAALGTTVGNARYGVYDYADPTYWMADGRENAVGNTMNGVGVGLFQAGVQSGNPMLMAIGGGAKAIGGLWNSAFGKKWNDKNIAKLDSTIAGMNSSAKGLASATNNNSLISSWNSAPQAFSFNKSYIGKDGWFTNGVSRKFDNYQKQMADAGASMMHAMNTGVENIEKRNRGTIYNSSAFGGPLDTGMSAVDYNFMNDWLAAKKDKTGKTNISGFFSYPGLFAYGGGMHNHGADWSNGSLHINAGGSHEENPNEGVQIGTDSEGVPNLVEEGEVIYNDYVYSNRIEMDNTAKERFHINKNRDITYAEMAKKLEKESEERPNDPISKKSLDTQMAQLAEEQERQKQEQKAAEAQQMFASLSPEEQVGLMQQVQAEEQASAEQQAMQAQAMSQGMQGMPQEQMLQGIEQQPMGIEAQMAQDGNPLANVSAYGGKVNIYSDGSAMDTDTYFAQNYILPNVDVLAPLNSIDHQMRLEGLAALDERRRRENFYRDVKDALEEENRRRNYFVGKKIKYYPDGGNTSQDYEAWLSGFTPYYQWLYRTLGITDDDGANGLAGGFSDTLERIKELAERDEYKDATLHAIFDNNTIPYRGNIDDFLRNVGVYDSRFADITPEQWRNVYSAYKNDYDAFSRAYPTIPYALRYDRGYAGQWNNDYLSADTDNTQVADNGASQDGADGRIRQRWVNGETEDIDNTEREIDLPEIGVSEKRRRTTVPNVVVTPAPAPHVPSPADVQMDLSGVQNGSIRLSRPPIVGENTLPGLSGTWLQTPNYMATPMNLTGVRNATTRVFPSPASDWDVDEEKKQTPPPPVNPPVASRFVMNHRATWPRYAGLFGPAVGLGMMAAGIGKPDYSGLNAALEGYDRTNARLADFKTIGNYLTYRPMDIWAEQNRLNANAMATNRAITNSGMSAGNKMAGLLANNYNNLIGSAELGKKALEYNDALAKQVGEFNRGTNMFNAQAYNQNSLANAQMLNHDRQFRASLASDIARTKMDADAGWYNSLYGNVAGLFKGFSDLGRENFAYNQAVDTLGSGAYPGVTREKLIDAGLGRYVTPEEYERQARRNRRGLTFLT